jgi:AcrR family transcriptional regulator
MSSQERSFERVNQKRRTRSELLRTARAIIEKGEQPSVAEVADQAGISRATAYRYFSTPDDMIREAVLDGVATSITLEPPSGAADVQRHLDKLVSDVFRMILDNEAVFRTLLSTSATGNNQNRRGGRRISWLKETLNPLADQMPSKDFQRLINALSLVMGIESMVVMRDICDLEPEAAEAVLRWTARTLLEGAMRGEA